MLSASIVFAEDNSTTTGTDIDDLDSTTENMHSVTSESDANTGSISDLHNDLIESESNLSLNSNYAYDTWYYEDDSALLDNRSKYHLHNVVIMDPRTNVNDNQKFKDALVKYGAIGVSVHGASKTDSSFNEATNVAYFYNETFGYGTDYTVILVGWNDSFSRYNFVNTPPGDGAWIVKNSWESNRTDEEYYYISYYDTAFGANKNPVAFIVDNSYMSIDSYRNIVKVTCFDEEGDVLPETEVKVVANGVEYTMITDDEGVAVFKLDLPAGKHTVTVINPVNGEEVNITLTIPSNKHGNTGNVKKVKTLQSYRAIVKDKVNSREKHFTSQSENDTYSQNIITGHLVLYIDGKVIFNITIVYDMAKSIFEFINSLLGNNEVKSDILKGLPGNYELKIDIIKDLPDNYEVKLDLINTILLNNGVKSEIANSLIGTNQLKIDYINSLLSNHDVKLEYTVDNDTTSYNENVTTN